jgi:hypothetical protein
MTGDVSPRETVDLDALDDEDPRRRLGKLSYREVEHEYRKGFKLLQKAGLKPNDSLHPPIRVMIRNTREGLRDDDLVGRRGIGERLKSCKRGDSDKTIRETVSQSAVQVPSLPLKDVSEFLMRSGGSASVSDVVRQVLRPRIGAITVRGFLTAARSMNLPQYGFHITENENSLVLSRPLDDANEFQKCLCKNGLVLRTEWARHILHGSWRDHDPYRSQLKNIEGDYACLVCPVGKSRQRNIFELVDHCQACLRDQKHELLGKALIETFLGDTSDTLRRNISQLFLNALHSDDRWFPWESISGGESSTSIAHSFPDAPPTPIYLDDSEDQSDGSDIVEIVDLDYNFINIED